MVNTDDGCARSPASRPKNVRMREEVPPSMKMDRYREELLTQPGMTLQNENRLETCEV